MKSSSLSLFPTHSAESEIFWLGEWLHGLASEVSPNAYMNDAALAFKNLHFLCFFFSSYCLYDVLCPGSDTLVA